jgi:glycosyltransferase involved in cell wall biosynthesis
LPRLDATTKPLYINQTLLVLAAAGLIAGWAFSAWNPWLPEAMRDLAQHEVIESRARDLNVGHDAVITGLKQDVRPYVALCDAIVLSSHVEVFSLAAIEGMTMRRPIVHSDVGGATEMIVPSRNGYLFPVDDTGALVRGLARLADRETCARMGDEARSMVESRFSQEAMVDRYEHTLFEVCGENSPAGSTAIR